MTAHSPLAIANAVLDEAARQGKALTIMQLLKLVYIAHGWSLALLGKALVNERPEAWQHGPVFPAVYRAFRKFGSGKITERASTPFGPLADADLSKSQSDIIKSVVRGYGDMHAFTLSSITHKPDTPWSQTYTPGQSNEIPDELIQAHYRELAHARQAQQQPA